MLERIFEIDRVHVAGAVVDVVAHKVCGERVDGTVGELENAKSRGGWNGLGGRVSQSVVADFGGNCLGRGGVAGGTGPARLDVACAAGNVAGDSVYCFDEPANVRRTR